MSVDAERELHILLQREKQTSEALRQKLYATVAALSRSNALVKETVAANEDIASEFEYARLLLLQTVGSRRLTLNVVRH